MWTTDEHGWYLADEATMNWPGMVVGCRGPRRQGRTSSSDYVTPVTAAPCGCTFDCLQPITHRSSRDSCHFPFLRVRKRVARLPIPPFPTAHPLSRIHPRLGCHPTPAATSSGSRSRWRNNRLQPRATHNHPRSQFSYASSNRPATAITFARKSSARYEGGQGWRCKGRACSTFPSFFFFLLLLVLFSLSLFLSPFLRVRVLSWSGELVIRCSRMANRPVKGELFPWIDKIIWPARKRKRGWNEMATRRIDEIHTVAMQ